MSHNKTWHHVRLLCVLTHDLKGWQDSQDKRGGDVTCSGYDEDDDDEEDWSQDYDKRGGDVTCGQGGEIIRVGIALEFRQSFCSQVLYTLRQWTTTTTIEIRQSFCSQAFPPVASLYNDIHRGCWWLRNTHHPNLQMQGRNCKKKLAQKFRKVSRIFSLLWSFGQMDADSSIFYHCTDTLSLH